MSSQSNFKSQNDSQNPMSKKDNLEGWFEQQKDYQNLKKTSFNQTFPGGFTIFWQKLRSGLLLKSPVFVGAATLSCFLLIALFTGLAQNWPVKNILQTPKVYALEQFDSCEDLKSQVQNYFKQTDALARNSRSRSNPVKSFLDNLTGTPQARQNQSQPQESSSLLPQAGRQENPLAMQNGPVEQNNAGSAKQSGGFASDFSGTNNQVINVDEGDILKSDGQYIYKAINKKKVEIIKFEPSSGNLQKVSEIQAPSADNWQSAITSLNLFENKLVVTGVGFQSQPQTLVHIYDISNKTSPKEIKRYELDGTQTQTRLTNGVLYTTSLAKSSFYDDSGRENIVPQFSLPKLKVNGNQQDFLDCQQIKYTSPIDDVNGFTNILAIDLKDVSKAPARESILSGSQHLYASSSNLYLAKSNTQPFFSDRNEEQPSTIFKFNLNSGQIKYQTRGVVPGNLLNQFSMDEHEGNLRVATTKRSVSITKLGSNNFNFSPKLEAQTATSRVANRAPDTAISTVPTTQTNGLYVLDTEMNIQGKIEGLAKNEKIYSVRFMGNKGYMVTFRQTDPLFTFDLSDPKNPQLKGELKIPGFSNYLHPISDGLLLGVGQEATTSGVREGVKISLFDVSNLLDPKELATQVVGLRGSSTPVGSDHKALLWDARNQLLTLPISVITDSDNNYQGSYVYKVTGQNGFELQTRISHLDSLKQNEKSTQPQIDESTNKKLDENGQVINGEASAKGLSAKGETFSQNFFIQRQMYIQDKLLTFSESKSQVNQIGKSWTKLSEVQ